MRLREMTGRPLAFATHLQAFRAVAVAGLALVALAACGGGDSDTTPTPTPTPTPRIPIVPPTDRVSPDTLNDLNECVTNIELGTPESCASGVNYPVTLTNQCSIEITVISDAQSAAEGWVFATIAALDPGETKRDLLNCVPNDTQRYRYCVHPYDVDDDHEDYLRCHGDDPPWQVLESFTPTPRTTPTPTPRTTPTTNTVTFHVTDACNDRRRVEYRFFEQIGGSTSNSGRSWPGGTRFWYTPGYDRTVVQRLACQAGTNVCYGARVDGNSRSYWGVGFEGDQGCTACCTRCGDTSPSNPRTIRIGCP